MLNKPFVRTGVIALTGLILIACDGDSVDLNNSEWDCRDKQCEVSFVLTNPGENEVEARYAIRAQSAVKTINSDLSDGLVVAEIKDSIMLAAGQSQTVKLQLNASRPPTNMSFKAWVK